jgi:DnaJ-class molecular chaperone
MTEGLSSDERNCLLHLAAAWNFFVAMPTKHPSETHEFQSAIHNAQCLIALRVARRVNPDFWYQPGATENPTHICERCGGTGVQQAGCWTGKAYDSHEGRCELCNGEGKLGVMETGS